MGNVMRFRTTLLLAGKTATGIEVPPEVVEGLGAGRKPPVDVDIELDTESREVTVPADFAEALDPYPEARRFFDGLSPSQKGWFVTGIEEAKKPETRQRRIEKAVTRLREGRGAR